MQPCIPGQENEYLTNADFDPFMSHASPVIPIRPINIDVLEDIRMNLNVAAFASMQLFGTDRNENNMPTQVETNINVPNTFVTSPVEQAELDMYLINSPSPPMFAENYSGYTPSICTPTSRSQAEAQMQEDEAEIIDLTTDDEDSFEGDFIAIEDSDSDETVDFNFRGYDKNDINESSFNLTKFVNDCIDDFIM